MTEATRKKPLTVYEQAIRQELALLLVDPHVPGWLTTMRRETLAELDVAGVPSRRQETWRYVNLRPWLAHSFSRVQAAGRVVPENLTAWLHPHFLPDAWRLVFVDGVFMPALSQRDGLPEAVYAGSLQTLIERDPDGETLAALQGVMNQTPDGTQDGPDALALINTLLFSDGFALRVPAGVQLSRPVQVMNVSVESQLSPHKAIYTRNVMMLEEGAEATVLMQSIGIPDRAGQAQDVLVARSPEAILHNLVHDAVIAPKARLNLVHLQNETERTAHLAHTRVAVQTEGQCHLTTVAFGAALARHAVSLITGGAHAEATMNGLTVCANQQEIFHHTTVDHAVPDGVTDQVYKSILDDQSRMEFYGTVVVDQYAQGTNAGQLNKSMLLSDAARVITRPQLKIYADDVKCSHGATVGELDADQLFYLASRGLSHDLAECLLTYGFAEEILQRLTSLVIRRYLDGLLLAALSQKQSPLSCGISCATCALGGHPPDHAH
ncbi:MAG: Fe-S cluster assembly protein SufD [Candidatus Melainabacteria bacterium]